MNIVFCNIGWLKYYMGQGYKDEYKLPLGLFDYNLYNFGHEGNNFLPREGEDGEIYFCGYVQPPSLGKKLGKLKQFYNGISKKKDIEYVENCLVIWIATPNDSKHDFKCDFKEKGSRIIGWYKDATCFIEPQEYGDQWYYFISETYTCILVPEKSRMFNFEKTIRNTWYAKDDINFREC